MKKNSSILKRYFGTYMVTMIVSIVVLGVILLYLSSRYFIKSQYEDLNTIANKAVVATVGELNSNNNKYREKALQNTYSYLAASKEIDLFWTDTDGTILVSLESDPGETYLGSIGTDLLVQSHSGRFTGVGTMGMYRQPRYILIVPVLSTANRVTSYIVATASHREMTEFLLDLLQMFGISTAVVIIISGSIIFLTTKKLTNPLGYMADSAKKFGKGDFSQIIPVESDDEIGQLGMALNSMAASLSTLENTRQSFIANTSHELKTPMTTIGGFVDGILDGTIPPEKQKYYLTIVSEEVKRLSRLVAGMLNVSKIEEGKMTLNIKTFDIKDTVFNSLLNFERQIEEKQIEIEGLEVDKVMVEGDEDLLHQVVYNLLDNAVKFVNKGGTISFGFHQNDKNTSVSIRNTGDGIPKEQLQMVFERFYKTDRSRALDKKGVGLGLYIVRTIVVRHGGDIGVRSKEGEFTEFSFTIPNHSEEK